MGLSKSKREALVKKFDSRCAYCGCSLVDKKWHADHVKPVIRKTKYVRDKDGIGRMASTGDMYSPENDCDDNLYPACSSCNIDKSSFSIKEWRKRLQDLPYNLRRNSSTFRHAERFGLAIIKTDPIVFWFEKFLGLTSREESFKLPI